MYTKYNEGKSVAAERFIRRLKNKILRPMTAISKNVYFDMLYDIVNKYKNTVHRTIKMERIDVTSDFYADYNKDSNETEPKSKAGDCVRISKYKNILLKDILKVGQKKLLLLAKLKIWTYVTNELNDEQIAGTFYEKKLQRTNQKKFRINSN